MVKEKNTHANYLPKHIFYAVHAWILADSLELNLEKIQNTPNLNFY